MIPTSELELLAEVLDKKVIELRYGKAVSMNHGEQVMAALVLGGIAEALKALIEKRKTP